MSKIGSADNFSAAAQMLQSSHRSGLSEKILGRQLFEVNSDGSIRKQTAGEQIKSFGLRLVRQFDAHAQSKDALVGLALRNLYAKVSPGSAYTRSGPDLNGQLGRFMVAQPELRNRRPTIPLQPPTTLSPIASAIAGVASNEAQRRAAALEASQEAAAAQTFRPLHDVRLALSSQAEARRDILSLGLPGRPVLALFEDHRNLGSAMKVSDDPQVRAEQGAKLISNLNKLERRIDDVVARGVLSPAQADTVSQLLARVQGEKALVGAVIANKLEAGATGATWTQALSLRRLGVDLAKDVMHDRPLDPGSLKRLGAGAMNAVYLVNDDQGRSFVYKPGLNYQDRLAADVVVLAQHLGAELNATDGASKEGVDLRYEARNVVASRLDSLVNAQLMVACRFGEIPVENFTFQDSDKKDEDINLRGDLHSDHGLLMDRAPGRTGLAWAGTADLDAALGSRELKRDLSNLVLLDAVLGSFDRHPGNYLLNIENGQYRGLKGIDNDFSLFATNLDAGSFRRVSDDEKAILAGKIPQSVREANHSGRVAVGNQMLSLNDLLDQALADPKKYQPGLGLTPELRSQLQEAVNRFDVRKQSTVESKQQEEKARKTLIELAALPAMREAWVDFASDVKALGLPETHPFWKFVQSGLVITDAYADVKVKQEALQQKMAAEGLDLKAGATAQQRTHNVGLPAIADRQLADRIRQPDFAKALEQAIKPLLTEREVSGTLDRLKTVQQHLDKLEAQGRLVIDWSSDHRAHNGQTIDEIVAEPGHSYWAVVSEYHQAQLTRNQGQFGPPH